MKTKTNLNKIVSSIFTEWYGKDESKLKGKAIKPSSIDYSAYKNDIDEKKFGEYVSNPDCEGTKYTIIDLPYMVGKGMDEVASYVAKTWPSKRIADIGHMDAFIASKPDIDAWTPHFFFGSLVRNSDGDWSVPYVDRDSSEWNRNGNWLEDSWSSDCRVVLFQDSLPGAVESSESMPFDIESLKLRIEKLEAWAKQIGYK